MLEWQPISFVVPSMSFDVMTKNLLGKSVPKVGKDGRVLTSDKIVPKARPRFFKTKKGKTMAFTSKNTSDFEAWIRRHFFMNYQNSNGGVYWRGVGWPVHDVFLGCQWLGEDAPCSRFKYGKDFLDCQACSYRRKNLMLNLEVHLKDERHIDLDNIIKIVLDALNKVFFYDDSQFVRKEVSLIPYSSDGEHLKISVGVVPETLYMGSVIGGYSLKGMRVDAAQSYVKTLAQRFGKLCANGFLVEYVRRCDTRKYTETLEKELL